ncbi:hypothetical protein PMAYCL1PPCAC_26064, partial [Pristionchus mayeri]
LPFFPSLSMVDSKYKKVSSSGVFDESSSYSTCDHLLTFGLPMRTMAFVHLFIQFLSCCVFYLILMYISSFDYRAPRITRDMNWFGIECDLDINFVCSFPLPFLLLGSIGIGTERRILVLLFSIYITFIWVVTLLAWLPFVIFIIMKIPHDMYFMYMDVSTQVFHFTTLSSVVCEDLNSLRLRYFYSLHLLRICLFLELLFLFSFYPESATGI